MKCYCLIRIHKAWRYLWRIIVNGLTIYQSTPEFTCVQRLVDARGQIIRNAMTEYPPPPYSYFSFSTNFRIRLPATTYQPFHIYPLPPPLIEIKWMPRAHPNGTRYNTSIQYHHLSVLTLKEIKTQSTFLKRSSCSQGILFDFNAIRVIEFWKMATFHRVPSFLRRWLGPNSCRNDLYMIG